MPEIARGWHTRVLFLHVTSPKNFQSGASVCQVTGLLIEQRQSGEITDQHNETDVIYVEFSPNEDFIGYVMKPGSE